MANDITITSLAAVGGVGQILLSAVAGAPAGLGCLPYMLPARIEFWASASNDRSTAVKVGDSVTGTFTYSGLPIPTTRYHWSRAIDISGEAGEFYPAPAAGIAATTRTTGPSSVGSSELRDNAVTTAKIAPGAVTAAELAALAVNAEKIAENAVTVTKLANEAVSEAKLGTGSVSTGKVAAGAIVAEKLAAGSVVADKIATNAVTATKIDAGAVTADKILAGAVTTPKLAAGAVIADHIAAGAVVADKIAANAVKAWNVEAVYVNGYELRQNGVLITEMIANQAVTLANATFGADRTDDSERDEVVLHEYKFTPSGGVLIVDGETFASVYNSSSTSTIIFRLRKNGDQVRDIETKIDDTPGSLIRLTFVDTNPGHKEVIYTFTKDVTSDASPGVDFKANSIRYTNSKR